MKKCINRIVIILFFIVFIFNNSYAADLDFLENNEINNQIEENQDLNNESENVEEELSEEIDNGIPGNLDLHCHAAVVLDQQTGKVLYDYNMNQRLYPASITKILTAIIVIENCDLNEMATASEYAVKSVTGGYTTADIKIGESFTVEELLEVMMLKSANETATILAEHVSGSLEEFSKLMNKKAEEIGCLDSHFLNANGMHVEGHYSTAYDMALIQRYCMQNEEYRRISKMQSCSLSNTELYNGAIREFKNTHGFLIPGGKDYYKYAISGKTGFTTPAKNCLATSAVKDGLEVVSTVFHAEGKVNGESARYYDTKQILEYAFDNYRKSDFLAKGALVKNLEIEDKNGKKENLKLLLEDDIPVVVGKGENILKDDGEVVIDDLCFPVKEGDVVGKITYEISGEEYQSFLVAGNAVDFNEEVVTYTVNNVSNDNFEFTIVIYMLLALLVITLATLVSFVILLKRENRIRNAEKLRRIK